VWKKKIFYGDWVKVGGFFGGGGGGFLEFFWENIVKGLTHFQWIYLGVGMQYQSTKHDKSWVQILNAMTANSPVLREWLRTLP